MTSFDFGSQAQQIVNSYRRDNPELSASARVKRAWNASADPRVAEHVTAVFIVPNTNASEVIIYVDDAIWASEFNLQSEVLRLKLNMQINSDHAAQQGEPRIAEQVEKLAFKVSKDKYIAKERKITTRQVLDEEEAPYKNAAPIELSDDEQSQLFIALEGIENDALRDIAYAAAKANLEWQKGIEKLGA